MCVRTCYSILCLLQSAVGWEYQTELSKHGSQTDAAKGFGGRYGVQTDRQDKVSLDVNIASLPGAFENLGGESVTFHI